MQENPEQRSRVMQAVKSKNTAPELVVRKILHKRGYRYRLHPKDLPGKPDIVFIKKKKAIFVHGCFWHGHSCAHGRKRPKNNSDYWNEKIERNFARDQKNLHLLQSLGWSVLELWECQLKDSDRLIIELEDFLKDNEVSAAQTTRIVSKKK